MDTILEKCFEEKATQTSNEILLSQWRYDKKLLSSALDAVSLIFPHYSLHNDSHSISIIDIITRLLGVESIEKLSAIDLWLLLEAAYCHDLGMVITPEMIIDAHESGELMEYLEQIRTDQSHEYKKYMNLFTIKDGKFYPDMSSHINNMDTLVKIPEAVRYLLSGYFRQHHGRNVRKAIEKPFEKLGIESPRAIIPARVYEMLGRICSVHTTPFKDVKDLPFAESALGIEDAHPRFIACMLRLGDVLDIDNGRFSEVYARTLFEMPIDSRVHKDKHRSISHLKIDTKSIEIIATCSDHNVAKITGKWFEMIRNEFNEQMAYWQHIRPNNHINSLPTIDQLKVDLIGYEIPSKPAFTIDITRALQFLQGTNLYNNPFNAFREALQNAVDSMLLRFWEEECCIKKQSLDSQTDNSNLQDSSLQNTPQIKICDLLAYAKDRPIRISIIPEEDNLKVIIKDQGIGISREELGFLVNTGSSSQNIRKRMKIEQMPEFLKPSGIFGIGFQSLYLLTDCVKIRTKSYYTDEQYEITLHSPTSVEYKGDIYLKEIKKDIERIDIGAELSFYLKKELVEEIGNDELDHKGDMFEKIKDHIEKVFNDFSKLSFFPLEFNNERLPSIRYPDYDLWFNKENDIETNNIQKQQYTGFYYKNSNITLTNEDFSPKFIHCLLNIHGRRADELLLLSRNGFLEKARPYVRDITIDSILSYYRENAKKIINDEKYKQLMSLFLRFYDKKPEEFFPDLTHPFHNIEDLYLDHVTSFIIDSTNKKNELLALRKILEAEQIKIDQYYGSPDLRIEFLTDKNTKVIYFYNYPMSPDQIDIFTFILKDLVVQGSIFFVAKNEAKREYLYLSKKDNTINHTICTLSESVREHFILDKKYFIPFVKGYEAIRISANVVDGNYFDSRNIFHKISVEKILFPFKQIRGNHWIDRRNDAFYKWVLKNHFDHSVSMEQIKEAYENLVRECYSLQITPNGGDFVKNDLSRN